MWKKKALAGLGEVLEGRRIADLGVHLKRRRRVLLRLHLEEDIFFLLPCKNQVSCYPLDLPFIEIVSLVWNFL